MVDAVLPDINIGSPRNPIDSSPHVNDPKNLVSAEVSLGGTIPTDTTIKEVIIGESLLNPSAHVAVTLQSAIYAMNPKESRYFNTWQVKDWNQYRCQPIDLYIHDNNPNNPRTMRVSQQIYRMDNRHASTINTGQVEEFTLHAIDNSILKDAQVVWEKSWSCATPSQIVREALQKIGATSSFVEQAGPARPYAAESIHPLQVIQQQANVALDGDDPSFLHYMTINDTTGQNQHHFTPLSRLGKTTPWTIYASDTEVSGLKSFSDSYSDYSVAVNFNFPCDFDILTDILNGIDCNGKNLNQTRTFNMVSGVFDAAGVIGQGLDIANKLISMTNLGTAQQQGAGGSGCETKVEKYLHKRQARMALLDRDKIALRITIPWTPRLHVGNKINFIWNNRYDQSQKVYGSGEYIIAHLTHNIQFGGYAVTNLDCITNTFGA